jgi:DNA-binding NarL/FixJ family response regulator
MPFWATICLIEIASAGRKLVKILVVDDHALVREGLSQVLKGLDEDICVLHANSCGEAFAQAHLNPDLDLVLLDYHLPDMNGLEAVLILGERHPELPVLMLSGSANQDVMRKVLRAGASGYISKAAMSDELLNAIQHVLDGGIYGEMPSDTVPAAIGMTDDEPLNELTPRQELVLQGLIDGRSNREIGLALHIAEETVKSHVTAILRYFSVQNRTQAVVAAQRAGYKSQISI